MNRRCCEDSWALRGSDLVLGLGWGLAASSLCVPARSGVGGSAKDSLCPAGRVP